MSHEAVSIDILCSRKRLNQIFQELSRLQLENIILTVIAVVQLSCGNCFLLP